MARGAAAPAGALAELEEASTVTAGRAPASAPTTADRRSPPRSLIAAAAATAVALVLTADGAPPRADAPKPPAMRTIPHVGHRPNGVALAGGTVWVTSNDQPDVERVDATTARKLEPVRVGVGASSIVGDGDAVWVALKPTHEVVRIDHSGKITAHVRPGLRTDAARARAPGRCGSPRAGTPAPTCSSATGSTATNAPAGRSATASSTSRRATGTSGSRSAASPTSCVSTRTAGSSSRGRRSRTRSARSPTPAAGYSGRRTPAPAAWRRSTWHGAATRVTTAVGNRPLRTVAAGGRVYVTVNTDHRVAILDPKTAAAGRPARSSVPPNPYAITADARYRVGHRRGREHAHADRVPLISRAARARGWRARRASGSAAARRAPKQLEQRRQRALDGVDRDHELVGDLLIGGRRRVARAGQRATERDQHAALRRGQGHRGRAVAAGRGRDHRVALGRAEGDHGVADGDRVAGRAAAAGRARARR